MSFLNMSHRQRRFVGISIVDGTHREGGNYETRIILENSGFVVVEYCVDFQSEQKEQLKEDKESAKQQEPGVQCRPIDPATRKACAWV